MLTPISPKCYYMYQFTLKPYMFGNLTFDSDYLRHDIPSFLLCQQSSLLTGWSLILKKTNIYAIKK